MLVGVVTGVVVAGGHVEYCEKEDVAEEDVEGEEVVRVMDAAVVLVDD